MYISVSIYAFVCANIFGAIVLKPWFKIDVVIMIIGKRKRGAGWCDYRLNIRLPVSLKEGGGDHPFVQRGLGGQAGGHSKTE